MTTTITVRASKDTLARMEDIASACGISAVSAIGNKFERALMMAAGVNELRKLLTPELMKDIMALQGTPLGFRTDKDRDGGYPVDTVRDCAIELILRGGSLVGNEMNIIAGRCYLTKEFFQSAQRQFPGLTDLRIDLATTGQTQQGTALVTAFATWKLNGVSDSMSCAVATGPDGKPVDMRIPVKINSGMGPDAIIGKAERKMRARIHTRITGTNFSEDEPEASRPAIVSTGSRTADLAAMLAAPIDDGGPTAEDLAGTVDHTERPAARSAEYGKALAAIQMTTTRAAAKEMWERFRNDVPKEDTFPLEAEYRAHVDGLPK